MLVDMILDLTVILALFLTEQRLCELSIVLVRGPHKARPQIS